MTKTFILKSLNQIINHEIKVGWFNYYEEIHSIENLFLLQIIFSFLKYNLKLFWNMICIKLPLFILLYVVQIFIPRQFYWIDHWRYGQNINYTTQIFVEIFITIIDIFYLKYYLVKMKSPLLPTKLLKEQLKNNSLETSQISFFS